MSAQYTQSDKHEVVSAFDASSMVVLNSPLKEFDNAGMLFSDSSTHSQHLVETTNISLSSLPPICKEFLSVQAEMLVLSTPTRQQGRHQFNATFEGLILRAKPIMSGMTRLDCYNGRNQMILLCPIDVEGYPPRTTPIGNTLCHEMTHAIGDIYDDRKSAERILAVLKHSNSTTLSPQNFQTQVIMKAADIVYPGTDRTFQEAYCKLAAKGQKSVVEACDEAEYKVRNKHKLNSQERAASKLLIEYASFAMESLFDEMKVETSATRLIDRYKTIYSESVRHKPGNMTVNPEDEVQKVVQEVVAVAMDKVIGHMITHITRQNTSAVLSTEHDVDKATSCSTAVATSSDYTNPKEALLATLSVLQETIAPALSRAEAKIIQQASRSRVATEAVVSDDSDDGNTRVKRDSITTSTRTK